MKWNRQFAMPNSETFSIGPISQLLDRWLPMELEKAVVIDPFARNSTRANVTNDLSPATNATYHMDAVEFVGTLETGPYADAVLFDPPYSPRQISECYQSIGKTCTTQDTQNARLYKAVKDGLDRILKPGGVAICCGWNSLGFGVSRGYQMLEILLVPHGGAHNDTIVTVERKSTHDR